MTDTQASEPPVIGPMVRALLVDFVSDEGGPDRAGALLDSTAERVRTNLRRLRLSAGLTHQQLANRVGGHGLSRSALSNIERGVRRVDVEDLMRLAVALGTGPLEILLPNAAGTDRERDFAWRWAVHGDTLENTAESRKRQVLDALKDHLRQVEMKSMRLRHAIENGQDWLRLASQLNNDAREGRFGEIERVTQALHQGVKDDRARLAEVAAEISDLQRRIAGIDRTPDFDVSSVSEYIMEVTARPSPSREAQSGDN